MESRRVIIGSPELEEIIEEECMTEQEAFWSGEFGDEYTERNKGGQWSINNIYFFSGALKKTGGIKSILELGCNRGLNLTALDYLFDHASLTGIDINAHALLELSEMVWRNGQPKTFHSGICEFETEETFDLVFTKGVLIHINPENLEKVYQRMYDLSNRYILVAEYYNPTPIEVPYRGYAGRLFKRDFAGDLLDRYPLKLIDYGFVYHRDDKPQDDLNWFLMEKEDR